MRRRGQIALFILIGLALLFSVGIALLFITDRSRDDVRTVLPEPETPVERFVSGCMHETLREGLFLLGTQGGYVQLPESIRADPRLTLGGGTSPVQTPVWRWSGVEYVPDLAEMEEGLALYVQDNIHRCLDNFTGIPDRDVTAISAPNATVSINAQDLRMTLDYTLEIASGQDQNVREDFAILLPLRLQELMAVAQRVLDASVSQRFFEQATIDLMSAADPRIPLTGMQFRCGQRVWNERSVRSELVEILSDNIPKTRVRGTDHMEFDAEPQQYPELHDISMEQFESHYCDEDGCSLPSGTPADQYEYNNLYMDAGLSGRAADAGINVGFRYFPRFGMDMTVRPSDDGVMTSETERGDSDYLSYLCMNVYHFTYDLRFPVEAVVLQEDAFPDGSDFVLRFGVPVAIEKNQPADAAFGNELMRPTQTDEQFCNTTTDEEVTIYVKDRFRGADINGADVDFECLRLRCDLGTTRSELNGIQRLTTELPSGCAGGIVRASKEGYTDNWVQLDAGETTVEVPLMPLARIYYRVDLGKSSRQVAPSPLRSGDVAYVTLTSTAIDWEQSFMYDPRQENYLEVLGLPGSYNVTLSVYEDDALIGGYMGPLRVDADDFDRTLTLHAYNQPPRPETAEDISDLYLKLKDDDAYKQEYYPVWN